MHSKTIMCSSGQANTDCYTDCTLCNLSDKGVELVGTLDLGLGNPPKTIPSGESGHFKHTANADAEGSEAIVAYTIVVNNTGPNNRTWVTAWSNIRGNPRNKVITIILAPNTKIDWEHIKTELEHSGPKSVSHAYGYVSYAEIEQNTDKPKMVSVLKKESSDEQITDTPNLASILKDVE